MKIPLTPHLLHLFVFHQVELGATVDEVAIALGIEQDWVRERVEAVRLCFAYQVRAVVSSRPTVEILRDDAA
jgi:hypothetical protein